VAEPESIWPDTVRPGTRVRNARWRTLRVMAAVAFVLTVAFVLPVACHALGALLAVVTD
jgi:hypothetical protein